MTSHNHTTIAIIGASFGGLSALLALRKRLGEHASIKMFDQRAHFTYIPSLHEAILAPKEALENVQIDLATYYPNQFVHQKITTLKENQLTTADGTVWSFDYLVIATGSRTHFFNNKKREENAHSVRYADDIEPLNTLLQRAKNITVIGGGYTGIEVAAIIAERKRPEQSLRIIHSRERLFNRLSNAVSVRTQSWFHKKNVDILLGKRVKDIEKDSIELQSGEILESDVTIVSRGIATNDELHKPTFTFKNGYTPIESEKVYICGDVASHGLYTTAHNAMMEGRRMGHLIADQIQGKTKQYKPLANRDKLAIALGSKDGIITNGIKGIYVPRLTGRAKRIIEKRVLFEFKRKIMLRV